MGIKVQSSAGGGIMAMCAQGLPYANRMSRVVSASHVYEGLCKGRFRDRSWVPGEPGLSGLLLGLSRQATYMPVLFAGG